MFTYRIRQGRDITIIIKLDFQKTKLGFKKTKESVEDDTLWGIMLPKHIDSCDDLAHDAEA